MSQSLSESQNAQLTQQLLEIIGTKRQLTPTQVESLRVCISDLIRRHLTQQMVMDESIDDLCQIMMNLTLK